MDDDCRSDDLRPLDPRPARRHGPSRRHGPARWLLATAIVLALVLGLLAAPRFVETAEATTRTHAPALVPSELPAAASSAVAALAGAAGAGDDGAGDAEAGARVAAVDTSVTEFGLIGVSTAEPTGGSVLVRTRHGDRWSEWSTLEAEPDEGPDAGSAEHGASTAATTAPLWVGSADGYEVNLPGDAAGVRVHTVHERVSRRLELLPEPAGAAGAPGTIHPRSSWGARPYSGRPVEANRTRLGIVHHSATGNGYAPSQVPGILRSIQAYHMDAQGWNDIGYNFAVDRFGRMWEARQGSLAEPVIGGHARGFNTGSVGVVVLGDHRSTSPSGAATEAVSDLMAWAFARDGLAAEGTVTYRTDGSTSIPAGTTVTLPRVIGHRDVGSTSCPGGLLFSRLGEISRQTRAAHGHDLARQPAVPMVGDVTGEGRDDVLWYRMGPSPDRHWRFGNGPFQKVSNPVGGLYRTATGDFDGNGVDDFLFHGADSGASSIWYHQAGSRRSVGITPPADAVPVVGDFDGNGVDDVLWYRWHHPDDDPDPLWLATRGQRFVHRSIDVDVFADDALVGDFDGNGVDDVFWYRGGRGGDELTLFGPALPGSVPSPRQFDIGGITGEFEPRVGDFDGNGRDDIFFYQAGPGTDVLWGLGPNGQTQRPYRVDGAYDLLTGDFDGDGAHELFWYRPGPLHDYLWDLGPRGAIDQRSMTVNGRYRTVVLDANGDDRDDLLWQSSTGADYLWAGHPGGRFASHRVG